MKSFKEFLNEDSKGSLTREGDKLVSKFITIPNVSGMITNAVKEYDNENSGKKMFSMEDDLVWSSSYDKDTHLIHINFTIDSESKHSGVLIINPVLGTVEPKITTKEVK